MNAALAQQVLACPITDGDSGLSAKEGHTVGGYLMMLLEKVWDEGDGFNGKRPFGNSGWQTDVAKALRVGGVVGDDICALDEDGYVESCDHRALDQLVLGALSHAALVVR